MIGIGIVGMPGSGKSILSEAARRLGIPVFVMGDAVREETLRRGLALTAENVLRVAGELRKKYGRGAVAHLIVEKIRDRVPEKVKLVVIEGLRSPEERKIFERYFDRFLVIAVHASPNTRYSRIVGRHRTADAKTIDMLVKRDEKELEFGIGALLAMADVHLVNEEKTKDEFLAECTRVLKNIATSLEAT